MEVLATRVDPVDSEHPTHMALRWHRGERVVKESRRDGRHRERETDRKQADKREELPAPEDLESHLNVVFQHGGPPQLT